MVTKIRWTKSALMDRVKIYKYWVERTKSEVFSKKLESLFIRAAEMVSRYPEMGKETDFSNIRVKVVKSYKLFYTCNKKQIEIIRVWDTRQDPRKINF